MYFYSSAKGRIGHVGYVVKVDKGSKTFTTTEGNTRASEYSENGGCVAQHTYSYETIGGTNRVNGFGRPRYDSSSGSSGGSSSGSSLPGYTVTLEGVEKGCKGPSVKILQRLLRSMSIKGKDGKLLKVTGVCDEDTVHAICIYQTRRRKHGIDVGTNGKSDGQCGKKMWKDIFTL